MGYRRTLALPRSILLSSVPKGRNIQSTNYHRIVLIVETLDILNVVFNLFLYDRVPKK